METTSKSRDVTPLTNERFKVDNSVLNDSYEK
jgi:hypothetical protein